MGRATAVIKGDGRSSSIAAASIIAKVTRERDQARSEIGVFQEERNKARAMHAELEDVRRSWHDRVNELTLDRDKAYEQATLAREERDRVTADAIELDRKLGEALVKIAEVKTGVDSGS